MDIRKFFGAAKPKSAAANSEKEKPKKESPSKTESDSSKKLKRKAQETESKAIYDDEDDFVQDTKKTKVADKKPKASPPKPVAQKKKSSRVVDDDDDFEVVHVKDQEEKMDIEKKPKKVSPKSKEPPAKKASPAKTTQPSPKTKEVVKVEPITQQKTKSSPKKVSPVKVKAELVEDVEEEEVEEVKPKADARANFRKWQSRGPPPLLGQKERPVGKPNCLQGFDFLLTGVLPSIERDDCHDLIKQYGGTISKSVTKKLTHLIVGEEAGESKLSKVKENPKIKIINEDELFELINNLPEKSAAPEKPAKKVKSSPKKPVQAAPVSVNTTPVSNSNSATNKQEKRVEDTSDMLWQDKYRPLITKDLVGNPGAVEQLKTWLNSWNKSFGGKTKASKGTEKAALLSGPPGLGKTSSAMLVAQECGYSPIEFNASDTRSKLAIKDQVAQIIDNRSLSEYFTQNSSQANNKPQPKKKTVVIMDEVDGMSSGDRGGMAELIQLIKKTQTPFICICNDRSNQKVRSLVNYCKDIRFKRPTIVQMVPRLKGIAKNEGLVMDDLSVEKVAEAARGDMRQAIGLLQMLSLDKKGPIKFSEQLKSNLASSAKNVDMGPFDATTRLIATAESLQDRLQYYFVDSSLVPLFVQENFLTIRPHFINKIKGVDNQMLSHLESLSACADSISDGDLVDKAIYSGTHWELQPVHAVLSTIKPTTIMRGTLMEQLRFPSWLGKNSSATKRARLLKEIQYHMSVSSTANKTEIRLHYLTILKNMLVSPMLQKGADSIDDVIAFMDGYDISKDDFDSINELAELTNADMFSKVPANVKTAFTREYNKHHHAKKVATGRASKSADADDEGSSAQNLDDEREPEKPFQEAEESDEDEDDVSGDKMIKKKERKVTKSKTKEKATKEKATKEKATKAKAPRKKT